MCIRDRARIDYVEVVDGATMQPTDAIGAMALVAMAVYIGSTRLIEDVYKRQTSPCTPMRRSKSSSWKAARS